VKKQDQLITDVLRLDSWLWRTRFFKTRTLASQAVSGGHVHLNGHRVKNSRPVKCGDQLRITNPIGEYRITVLNIPHRRGPAAEAAACYRQDELLQKTLGRGAAFGSHLDAPPKRPDKKSRRSLRALKGRI
jgi:ribosome-associated heat shock protein Hsp15